MSRIIDSFTPAGAQSIDTGLVLFNVACDSSVTVGSVVYLDAAGVAYKAKADDKATSNFIGIVINKTSSTLCDIRVSGTTTALFVGLDPTKEYFLSATVAGEISTVVPTTSGHVRIRVGQPYSATKLVVIKGEAVIRA